MPDKAISQNPLLLSPLTGDFLPISQSGVTYRVPVDYLINLRNNPSGFIQAGQTGQFVTTSDTRQLYFTNKLNSAGINVTGNLGVNGTLVATGTLQITGNIYNYGTGFFRKLIVGNTGTHNATGNHANVLGGEFNRAEWDYTLIGGGSNNTGWRIYDTVVNGLHNSVSGGFNTIINGQLNTAVGTYHIIGGYGNTITVGNNSAIIGGTSHIVSIDNAFIGGGSSHRISGVNSACIGGETNYLHGDSSVILAGAINNSSGEWSVIAGRQNNNVGVASFVHGIDNRNSGDYSFLFGQTIRVTDGHDGTVIFADSNATTKQSVGANAFHAFFANGAYITGNGSLFVQNHVKSFGTGTFVSGLVIPFQAGISTNNSTGSLYWDRHTKVLSVGNGTNRVNLIATGVNIGTGVGIVSGCTGASLLAKTLVGGTGILILQDTGHIYIHNSAPDGGGGGGGFAAVGPTPGAVQIRGYDGNVSGNHRLMWYDTPDHTLKVSGHLQVSGQMLDLAGNAPTYNKLLGGNSDGTSQEWKTIAASGNGLWVDSSLPEIVYFGVNDDKTYYNGRVATTNDTFTTIISFTPSVSSGSSTYFIEVEIVGVSNATNKSAAYKITAAFRCNGSSVTITNLNGATKLSTHEFLTVNTDWDVDINGSGNIIRIQVKGENGATVYWKASARVLSVNDQTGT